MQIVSVDCFYVSLHVVHFLNNKSATYTQMKQKRDKIFSNEIEVPKRMIANKITASLSYER